MNATTPGALGEGAVEQAAERLAVVRARIAAAGGDVDHVQVCAVTKGFDADAVRMARAVGLDDIGENYAQELLAKADQLTGEGFDEPRWHMIGRLQRNKVRALAAHVHLWQSVDRPELGAEIARHAPGASVLVQVGAANEPDKGGCPTDRLASLVEQLRVDGLVVRGLMAVGPTDPGVDSRPVFEAVAAAAERLGLAELSMGMSRDLEAAVSCGATMVRVGTALFGPRPGPRRPPGPGSHS